MKVKRAEEHQEKEANHAKSSTITKQREREKSQMMHIHIFTICQIEQAEQKT